jgi:glutamate/tyrosine decarboxylase-like PLP-dependent enzyme
MQYMGQEYADLFSIPISIFRGPDRSPLIIESSIYRGYLNSARSIVGCARKIAEGIRREIPELYILGNPPASVIAFAAKPTESFNALQVGDIMKTKGWHLNGLSNPPACHIACTVSSFCRAEIVTARDNEEHHQHH